VRRRILLALGGLAALAAPLVIAPAAFAGTYQITDDTSQIIDSWTLSKPSGYFGCSFASRPGPCADADVAVPTSLRIFALGNVAANSEAHWYWVAPPTVSIASGSITVDYNTTADTRVYMKARLRSQSFGAQPQLHTSNDKGTATWGIPAGDEAIAIYLESLAAHNFGDKWQNHVNILSMQATLRDDTAPVGSLSGALADGQWLNQSQPVCLNVSAADEGSGVASSQLRDALGTVLDSQAVALEAVRQPGEPDYSQALCLTPSSLNDGDHSLTVRVADAAGELLDLPLTVHTDSHAPVVRTSLPGASTTDRRPMVSFSVDAGPSGLASFQAEVDGRPMSVLGDNATYLATDDLAFGRHTVTWSATDLAGNHRDAFWTFDVVDDVAPSLSGAQPADGASFELRRPAVSFQLSDAGSGVDPASLRVLLDGSDVAPFGSLTDGRFGYQPQADLGYGRHVVRVAVSDRSGNAMAPVQWSFDVVDLTAPVLGDVRPDDGSGGSDRTPSISFALDDAGGTGVDADSIVVTLDGADVTAGGALVGGRFALTPAQPLSFGSHTVVARAADVAGNVSSPLSWSFDVRDELAPVIANQLPLPGSTVAGAVTIGFDVSDLGTGVDDGSLQVMVDGSDVAGWGTLADGRFRYAPGNLGAGVHTVAVTVADRAGNSAGPVMWQFAVADPATLDLVAVAAPGRIVAGQRIELRFVARSNGTAMAGAVVRASSRSAGQLSFSAGSLLTAGAGGEVSLPVAPLHTTTYRFELASDPSVSVEHTVVVAERVTLSVASATARHGTPIRLSGRLLPAHPGLTLRIQMLTGRGWVTVATPRLSTRSLFSSTLLPRVRGRYLFRVVAPATALNASGTSRTVSVRVT
jgi:hypothetical protein